MTADADYFDRLRSRVREAEAGRTVALDFIGALEDACRRITEQPAGGSPRHAHEMDIPGLRFSLRHL